MRSSILILLPDGKAKTLATHYDTAFNSATELYIVSAYLTHWEMATSLNMACRDFRFVIGQDFGITRKQACRDVMAWLPKTMKRNFVVADEIEGFHPKAIFWLDADGDRHALIGSSNLTRAAFSDNHEVNVYFEPSAEEFARFKAWVNGISHCAVVSEEWLANYKEAQRRPKSGKASPPGNAPIEPLVGLELPVPPGASKVVKKRRKQLDAYKKAEAGLSSLFQDCASGKITSTQFYASLPKHWSWRVGNRLQGAGWERKGKNSNFRKLSQSYGRIVGAPDFKRDQVVAAEIDWLTREKIPTRTSFLTEMLCLRFPHHYPVINDPVKKFLKAAGYRKPRGASEGAKYIDFAKRLRVSLRTNPEHPAKSICELDYVLWQAYGIGTSPSVRMRKGGVVKAQDGGAGT